METNIPVEPSVAVITCTTGRNTLLESLNSIFNQTHKNIQHYIVTDAAMDEAAFNHMRASHATPNRHFARWPTKVGGEGWECRRLWSAIAPLVNEDLVCFLNDDDWFEPQHIESLVNVIKSGFDWGYAFRKIYNEDGTYLCDDICESLGEAHPVWNMPWQNFAEQGSVLMYSHCYRAIAPYFASPGFGNDRLTYQQLRRLYPKFAGTGLHTVCFRLGGTGYSVTKEFFEEGNKAMRAAYPDGMPWIQKK